MSHCVPMEAEIISQYYDRAVQWMQSLGFSTNDMDPFMASGGCNPLAYYYICLHQVCEAKRSSDSRSSAESIYSQDQTLLPNSVTECDGQQSTATRCCDHDSVLLYSCRICDLALSDKFITHRHIREIHLTKHKCSKCDFAADTGAAVRAHISQSPVCDGGKRIRVEIDTPMHFDVGKLFEDRTKCADYLTKHSNECLGETPMQMIRHLLRSQDVLPTVLDAGEELKMWDPKDGRKWRRYKWTEPVITSAIARLTRRFDDRSDREALNQFVWHLLRQASPSEKRYSGGNQIATGTKPSSQKMSPTTPVEVGHDEDLLPNVMHRKNAEFASNEPGSKDCERPSSSKRPLSVFSASQIPYRIGHPPLPRAQTASQLPIVRVRTPLDGLRTSHFPARRGFLDSTAALNVSTFSGSSTLAAERTGPSFQQLRNRLETCVYPSPPTRLASSSATNSWLDLDISNVTTPSSLNGDDDSLYDLDSPHLNEQIISTFRN